MIFTNSSAYLAMELVAAGDVHDLDDVLCEISQAIAVWRCNQTVV